MDEKSRSTFINEVLKLVAPGTPLREGLDNVLRAKTGGLIVLGYNQQMASIVDGGFYINCDYSPSALYELSKMDGAIILDEEGKKILYANTQLNPSSSIESNETGIRHRTAERVAKQTGNLVVAISQRRNVITLYQGEHRYSLKDIGVILTKANQALMTLEKYKTVLDQGITNLGALEFEELVTLQDVVEVIHRVQMVLVIKSEIINYVNELGSEGRLITMQLNELVNNIEKEAILLVKDYYVRKDRTPFQILRELTQSANEELLDESIIIRALGYVKQSDVLDLPVSPRGYRILHKIPRLPSIIIENLVEKYGHLPQIVSATIEELDEVEGIGLVRAKMIKDGLNRIQEQLFIDRHL